MDDASKSSGLTVRPTGQVILSIAVVLLGTALAYGTYQLPEATGYAKVGPRLMSGIVSGGLLILGFMLLRESLAGGFRDVDESEFADTPTHWEAFAWISGGLILNGILIVHAGFVIAGTLLFVLAARGFGSKAYIRNAIIGLVIAAVTYSFFTFGLGLALPKGVMPV
jgi:putative tricarboxylic transport membrane protein